MTKGLNDRMPAYVALATKYGMTLPQVLDRARLPAKDKAFLLASAPRDVLLGTMGPMTAVAKRWADIPRGGLAAATAAAQRAAGGIANAPHAALIAAESQLRNDAFYVGQNIGQGLADGMAAMQGPIGSMARSLGAQAVNQARLSAGVMSPSIHTRYVGEMLGEGLIIGMANRHGDVTAAAGHLGAAAANVPVGAMALPGGGMSGASGGMGGGRGDRPIVVEVHLDGRVIHRSYQTHELQYQVRNARPSTARG